MIIKFSEPHEVSAPGRDGLTFEFPCHVIESNTGAKKDDVRKYRPRAEISGSQLAIWNFDGWSEGKKSKLIAATLFEYVRKEVFKKIIEGDSPDGINISLNTNTAESEYPFDTDELVEPEEFEVEFDLMKQRERCASDQDGKQQIGFDIPDS